MFTQLCVYASAHLPRRQRGLTTVEYAIAGGLIAAAVVGAFLLMGTNVGIVINRIAGSIK